MSVPRSLKWINFVVMCFALFMIYSLVVKAIELRNFYSLSWVDAISSVIDSALFWFLIVIVSLGIARGSKVLGVAAPILNLMQVIVAFATFKNYEGSHLSLMIIILLPFILWGYCSAKWIFNKKEKFS